MTHPEGQPLDFAHASILVDAVVALARRFGARRLVDCTAGGAGHSAALLEALPDAVLLALDRDQTAVHVARERLRAFGARAQVVHAPFAQLGAVLESGPLGGAPDFVFADFGVSSHQLDTASRGFSFRADGPLDMRMDASRGQTAAELIAHSTPEALADIIWRFGEERHSRRIARALCAANPTTTLQAAQLVRAQLPRPKPGMRRIDPATRTFQALRVAVNDELGQIEGLLADVPTLLAPGGVFAALSFHSLEDRLVKLALRRAANPCTCPPDFPVCACARAPSMRVVDGQGKTADEAEVARNPRARSARLRWGQRLPVAAADAPG